MQARQCRPDGSALAAVRRRIRWFLSSCEFCDTFQSRVICISLRNKTSSWGRGLYHLPKSSQRSCFENENRRLIDAYGSAPTCREDSLVLPSA
jgi:hypothetical protein